MIICEECKMKPATVHFTQNIQGKKTEMHLCEECAAQKGNLFFNIDSNFSIPNLLGSFLGYNLSGLKPVTSGQVCPNCKTNFNDIRHMGKLGCSECYLAFEQELEPTLRRIHGNSRHIGRVPLRGGGTYLIKKQIADLKNQLQIAVNNEEYEKAAVIRDKIKKLESELK